VTEGLIAAYVLAGILAARWVRIHALRKAPKQDEVERCRSSYYYGACTRHYRCTEHRSAWSHHNPLAVLAFAAWPLLLAWLLLLGFIWVVAVGSVKIGFGIGKAAAVVAQSPPAHLVARVNKWFWQDPRDRKKNKTHV
jgi:hypothetical protein